MTSWLQQLFGTSPWEAAAVVLALAYLLLAVRRSLLSWPCALASAAIYLVLFARQALYMQTVLQLFYIGMAVYGFREWRRGRTAGGQVAITSRPWRWHVISGMAVVAAALVNGWLLARFSQAQAPYVDAFVTWGSVLTTWMVARRIIENWLYWILFDSVAAYLYFTQGLTATGLLFVGYVGIVIHGYVVWRRAQRLQQSQLAPARAD
jgi:nicotinamide mononucleotide transporter